MNEGAEPAFSVHRSARDASVGSGIRLAAEVVVRLSSIVATLWLTRSLGVSAFGAFLLALSIGLIIAELCDLGLNAIVVPLVVKDPSNLRTLCRMKAAMTLSVAVLSAAVIPAAAWATGVGASLLSLTTIHFLGASWIEMAGTALRALGRRFEEALLLFVFRFTLVGLVIGAPFGAGLLGAARAYAISIAPGLIAAALLLLRHAPAASPRPPDFRSIVRQAVPMGLNGYLAIFSTRVELFVLQAARGEHVVGLFGGGLRIVESLLTLPSAIAAGALPSVARDLLNGSKGAAQRMFGSVVWIGVPAGVGIALCAPQVLEILGPGFVEGAPALRLLSLALVLCFANAALFHVIIASGETAVIPRLTATRVLGAVALSVLLIPAFGLVGAAVSFTSAEALLFSLLVRRVRVHAVVQVGRPVVWAVAASVPMSILLSLWPLPLLPKILVGASLFFIFAAAILRGGSERAGLA